MKDDRTTQRLREEQAEREAAEREGAAGTATEEGTAQHERRADKAEYLKEKLRERAEAEREE